MEQGYLPADGIRSMMSGTPSILGILAVREGAALIAEAGIDQVRRKSIGLTQLAYDLAQEWLVPAGFGIASPADPSVRGSQLSIARADARELCGRLTAAGVIPDFRTPDIIRIGLSPLPMTYTEVWDAMAVIRDLAG